MPESLKQSAIPEKARCLDAPVFSDRVMATFETSDPLANLE